MKNLIEKNIQKIAALCKKHKVSQLFVFGSILTGRFNDGSDIDLIVTFNKTEIGDYFNNYFDFLEEQTIKNPYLKKNLDATKMLIYNG